MNVRTRSHMDRSQAAPLRLSSGRVLEDGSDRSLISAHGEIGQARRSRVVRRLIRFRFALVCKLAGVGFERSQIDFVEARNRIEELRDVPSSVRARALAALVGLCAFADEDGVIAVPSVQIAAEFEISRVSWLQYRDVLERAGLVAPEPGPGRLNRLRLLSPL